MKVTAKEFVEKEAIRRDASRPWPTGGDMSCRDLLGNPGIGDRFQRYQSTCFLVLPNGSIFCSLKLPRDISWCVCRCRGPQV